MRTKILILILAVTSSGCYQYFPVADAAPLPEPGAEVRAQLASPQPVELGTMTIHDISIVEGDVYRTEGDTLAVFSRRIFSAYGFRQFTNGAVFYFDRSQFGRLEQRKLVPWRSGIAAGAAAAGVVAAMYFLLDFGGGAEGNGTPPPPTPKRGSAIPLRFTIPR